MSDDQPSSKAPEETARQLSQLAQGVGAIAAVAASFAGFVVELTFDETARDTFIATNRLPQRDLLAHTLVTAAGAAGFVTLAYMLVATLLLKKRRAAVIAYIYQLGMFLLPLVVCVLLPLLFRVQPWIKSRFELVVLIPVLGLLVERLLRTSLAHIPAQIVRATNWLSDKTPAAVTRWGPLAFVAAGVALYVGFCSYYTILHHRRLGTACFDLGQYDNLFFNASIGHPFKVPSLAGEEDWASLKGHAELGMYALLPFYMLRRSPETLLILQSLLLGTAAIPLFLMAKRYLSPWAAMVVALSYLFYGPLIQANFYDFHMQPIAAAYTMWMIYFFVARKNVPFWVFFTLALTAREDISIGLAVFGTFLVLSGYRVSTGLAVVGVSLSYFVLLKFIIMPMFGDWWFARIYKDLQVDGSKGYGSVLITLFTNPAYVIKTIITKKKLVFFLEIMAPLLFLPMRRRYLALAIVPGFVFTLLTTGYGPTVSTKFQYNAYYIPYIFPATVVALRVLGGGSPRPEEVRIETNDGIIRRRAALAAIVFASVLASFHNGAFLQRESFVSGFSKIKFNITPEELQRYGNLQIIKEQIPPGASVAATEKLAPHVSSRSNLYCFRGSIGDAEYVLIGPDDRKGKSARTVKNLLSRNKFGVLAEQGGFLLIRKGANPTQNAGIVKRLGL